MKTHKLHLVAILFFYISGYSQNKEVSCQKINADFQYFQVSILADNLEPRFINVVGQDIKFDSFSKESLTKLIDDLYKQNYFVPSLINDRSFYLNKCQLKTIDESQDLKFTSKFNGEFEKVSEKKSKYYTLKTGEKILIKGMRIRGTFLSFKKEDYRFSKMSFTQITYTNVPQF